MPLIAAVDTSVTAFIGVTHSGPLQTATKVLSFVDYQAHFGPLDSASEVSFAARQFFSNGGSTLYVVRAEVTPNSIQTALQALNKLPVVNLICLPGVTEFSILDAARKYCESRRAFLVIDAPGSATTPQQLGALMSNLQLPKSASAAIYAPWLQIPDPLGGADPRTVAPSGAIAAIFAKTDSARGVWKAPAGLNATLAGVSKLAANFSDGESQALENTGLNLLRSLPAEGIVVWSARTLDASTTYKYIPVRRLALFLEQSLLQGTQWVVFEPNAEPLWAQLRTSVGTFLQTLFLQAAFQGSTPSQAYFVKCDSSNNPQSSIDQGVVNVDVGFAPLKPAEFVILQIQQMGLTPAGRK